LSAKPISRESSANRGAVSSPCTGVCALGAGDLCIGCLRSADEIGNWLRYSPQHRERIINELPDRLQTLFAR
jgi:hypothetical protein